MSCRPRLLLALLTLILSGGCSGPSRSEPGCCPLTVRWRTYQGSPLDPAASGDPGARRRLARRLNWVAQYFRKQGICLKWEADQPSAMATVFVGGPRQPQLVDLTRDASPDHATVWLVDQLLGWVERRQRYELRKGATQGAGAYLAVVDYADDRRDAVAIRDELLHVFGLTDDELEVAATGRHQPRPVMWRFVRDVCRSSGDRAAKRALMLAKEECRREHPGDPDVCYR